MYYIDLNKLQWNNPMGREAKEILRPYRNKGVVSLLFILENHGLFNTLLCFQLLLQRVHGQDAKGFNCFAHTFFTDCAEHMLSVYEMMHPDQVAAAENGIKACRQMLEVVPDSPEYQALIEASESADPLCSLAFDRTFGKNPDPEEIQWQENRLKTMLQNLQP